MGSVNDRAGAAQIRAEQREEWTAVSPRWRVPRLDGDPHPVHQELITMAEVHAGHHVLDLACGTGSAALLKTIGPEGSLLGLDLSPGMVEIARHWAHAQGLSHVQYRAISTETALGVEVQSVDRATCMFGLMYMPERVQALRGLYEALIPGGRVAICTWSTVERCPFLSVPLQVIRRHIAHPMLALEIAHPFAIPSTGVAGTLLAEAGFVDILTATTERPVEPQEPEAYWEYLQATGWPLAFLPEIPAETREALHDDMIATLTALFPDGPVRLGGEAILAVGTKPDQAQH